MTTPDSLQTARLDLRKPCLDDAPLIFKAYGQDAEVTRYLMWRPHKSVEDAQAAVQRFLSGWISGTFATCLPLSPHGRFFALAPGGQT